MFLLFFSWTVKYLLKEDWGKSCKEDKDFLVDLICETNPDSLNNHRLAFIFGPREFDTLKKIVDGKEINDDEGMLEAFGSQKLI